MMARSVTSIKEIAIALNLPYKTVENDIRYIKTQTRPWLYGLAGEGFAFDCRMAIDKFLSIERELEEMREDGRKKNLDTLKRLAIIKALHDITSSRLILESEGPTLLALRKLKSHAR